MPFQWSFQKKQQGNALPSFGGQPQGFQWSFQTPQFKQQQQKMQMYRDIQSNAQKSLQEQNKQSSFWLNAAASAQGFIQNIGPSLVNAVMHPDATMKGAWESAIGTPAATILNFFKPTDVADLPDAKPTNLFPGMVDDVDKGVDTPEQKQAYAAGKFFGYIAPYSMGSDAVRATAFAAGYALDAPKLMQLGPVMSKVADAVGFVGTGQILHQPGEGSRANQALMDLATLGVFEAGGYIWGKAWQGTVSEATQKYIDSEMGNLKDQMVKGGVTLQDAETKVAKIKRAIVEDTGRTPEDIVGSSLPQYATVPGSVDMRMQEIIPNLETKLDLVKRDVNKGPLITDINRPEDLMKPSRLQSDAVNGKVSGLVPKESIEEQSAHFTQAKADADWEANYAEKAAKYEAQSQKLFEDSKKLKGEEKKAALAKKAEIDAKAAKLEDDFMKKWKPEAKSDLEKMKAEGEREKRYSWGQYGGKNSDTYYVKDATKGDKVVFETKDYNALQKFVGDKWANVPVGDLRQETSKVSIPKTIRDELLTTMDEIKNDKGIPASFKSLLAKIEKSGTPSLTKDEAVELKKELENAIEKNKEEYPNISKSAQKALDNINATEKKAADVVPPREAAKGNEVPARKISPDPRNNSVTLGSGFDPGVDKFIAEDVVPTVKDIKKSAGFLWNWSKAMQDFIVNSLDPALKARMNAAIGEDPVASIIRMSSAQDVARMMFDNKYIATFDGNTRAMENFFNKFSHDELNDFMLTLGEPTTAEGKLLQDQAKARLNPLLMDPKLMAARSEIAKFVLDTGRSIGLDIADFGPDYFRGRYKITSDADAQALAKYLDVWKTNSTFLEHKAYPTYADAKGMGMPDLRDVNPVANLRSEIIDMYRWKGMNDFATWLKNTPDKSFAVEEMFSAGPQYKDWLKVNDPQLKNYLFHPDFANVANNLLEFNKITGSEVLSGIRKVEHIARYVKFFGSMFHARNIMKVAFADHTFGMFDPRAYRDIGKSLFKSIDPKDPMYLDYLWNGGGYRMSIESTAMNDFQSAFDKFARGNYIGGTLSLPLAPWRTFNEWMFNDWIPYMKFDSYRQQVMKMEDGIGRSLTDAEKQNIIRSNQNFYGELNERLFGRSATVTSALRFLFTAPGFGEGNFRTAFKALVDPALKAAGKGVEATNSGKATQFIVNSLIGGLVLGMTGTRIRTGQWPSIPNPMDPLFSEKIRDLFKIDTGEKNANGDTVYYDMLTYDRDYWYLYGDLLTGRITNIPGDMVSRSAGAAAPIAKVAADLGEVFLGGKPIVDNFGNKVYSADDPFPTKVQKLVSYEAQYFLPISVSNFGVEKQRGQTTLQSVAAAVSGIAPTTSEVTKTYKNDKYQLYDIRYTYTPQEQSTINKLASEQGIDAAKAEKDKWNNDTLKRLEAIFGTSDKSQWPRIARENFGMPSFNLQNYLISSIRPKQPPRGYTGGQ